MQKLVDDVTAFHRACGVPIVDFPSEPPGERVTLRIELIQEEGNRELLPAMVAGDIVAIADAMVDLIYVVVGAAIEYGIPLARVWDYVHAANMAKVDPNTGKVIYRADGKVLKPKDWQPPDIKAALFG